MGNIASGNAPHMGKFARSAEKKKFAKVCLSAREKKQINMMEESEQGYDEDDIFYTDTVTVENKGTSTLEVSVHTINVDSWIVPLTVNGTEIHMKLDTGAMANLITSLIERLQSSAPQASYRKQKSGIESLQWTND